MNYDTVLAAVQQLSWDERARLIFQIQEEMAAELEKQDLDENTKRLLEQRVAEMEANPNDSVPWAQVYAETRARLGR